MLGVRLGRRRTSALQVHDAPARRAHSDALPTACPLVDLDEVVDQGPRPPKLAQQQRRASPRQASCIEHPLRHPPVLTASSWRPHTPENVPRRQRRASRVAHPNSASTSSDSQLLAVHGQLLAVHGQLLAVQRQACPFGCRRITATTGLPTASLSAGRSTTRKPPKAIPSSNTTCAWPASRSVVAMRAIRAGGAATVPNYPRGHHAVHALVSTHEHPHDQHTRMQGTRLMPGREGGVVDAQDAASSGQQREDGDVSGPVNPAGASW